LRSATAPRLGAALLLLATAAVLVLLGLDPDGIYGSFIGRVDARAHALDFVMIGIIQAAVGVMVLVTMPSPRFSIASSGIALAWAGLGAIIWVQLLIYAAAGGPSPVEDPPAGLLSVSLGLTFGYLLAAVVLYRASQGRHVDHRGDLTPDRRSMPLLTTDPPAKPVLRE
jgi:hypothetical protein